MTGAFGTFLLFFSLLASLTRLLTTTSNNTVTVEEALSDECINAAYVGATLLGWINVYNIYGECTVQTECTEAGKWSGDDDVASLTNLRPVLSAGDTVPAGIYRSNHSPIIYKLIHSCTLGAIDLLQDNLRPQKSKAGLIKHPYFRNNRDKSNNGRKLSVLPGDDDDYFVYPNFPVEYGPYGCIDSTLGEYHPLAPSLIHLFTELIASCPVCLLVTQSLTHSLAT